MTVTKDTDRNLLLQEEVHPLLQKGVVELVNPPPTPGFYSRPFLVPKKNGKIRPVTDLFVLNQHLIVPHFKMETNISIRGSIHLGMWRTSIDLTYAYFHIPIYPQVPQVPEICLGMRFQDDVFWPIYSPSSINQNVPGSGSTFKQPVNFHQFLFGRFPVEKYVPISSEISYPFCDRFAPQTGFLISWKKSELVPSQDFIFLGEHYRTYLGLVFPPEEKIVTLQFLVNKFVQVSSVPARQFVQLIGSLIILIDVIPLGRLQFRGRCLGEFWDPVTQMWEAYIHFPPRLLPHLQWWLEVEPFDRSTSGPPEFTVTLYTDASLTGWSAFL
jgi:hypothetical protein